MRENIHRRGELHLHYAASSNAYAGHSFDPRVQRLLAKTSNDRFSRNATPSEIASFADQIRSELVALADDAVIEAVRRHNPSIFQVLVTADRPDQPIALNAALHLNADGAKALVTGRFNAFNPDLAHIAAPGARVEAIYGWLIWTRGSFIHTLKGLSDHMVDVAPHGCALFCRGATPKSEAFMRAVGFEDAALTYPDAPQGLLTIHPVAVSAPPKVTVELAQTMNDMLHVFAVRSATYIADQYCPYDEEFDGNDFCAAHLIGKIDGEPAGCIRIRFFGDFVKFERLAVRREFRQSKLAFRLVRAAMRYAARKGYRRVYGHARHDLVRFWQSFGFRALEGGQMLSFSDVDYVEMEGALPAVADRLHIGDNPYRIIRPENHWDRPGPLERPTDPRRQAELAGQWRRSATPKAA